MTEQSRNHIDELARRAFDIARPTSFKAYAVERVFRESVKAVTEMGTTQPGREDCIHFVSGRLQKLVARSEQVYPVKQEKASFDAKYDERVTRYSEYFVDEILFGMCDGKPSRLKRLSNNLADGFFAATLSLVREQSEKSDNEESVEEATEESAHEQVSLEDSA